MAACASELRAEVPASRDQDLADTRCETEARSCGQSKPFGNTETPGNVGPPEFPSSKNACRLASKASTRARIVVRSPVSHTCGACAPHNDSTQEQTTAQVHRQIHITSCSTNVTLQHQAISMKLYDTLIHNPSRALQQRISNAGDTCRRMSKRLLTGTT